MAKVKDVYPSPPIVPLNARSLRNATLSDIWANYDDDTDSMIIYVTGKPVPGVNIYLGDDVYAIADPRDSNNVVGLYFESWENYVPKLDIVNRSWNEIKDAALNGIDVTLAIRVLALDLIMSLGTENTPALQLA